MENIEMGCIKVDVSAVANLVEYIEKHRLPYTRRLKDMAKEIRRTMQKQERLGKGIDKTVYEAKSELNTNKLQLRHVSKNLENVKTKIPAVRQKITYEKTLKDKAKDHGIKNTVPKSGIKKLPNDKDKEIKLLTREQMRLKSSNTELETRLRTVQDKVQGMKLKHEQDLQVMDMQICECRRMQMNMEEALKTLYDADMQLDAILSPQKTYLEALPMHVKKCFTKYKYIGKTSCLEEVAYSIRNKVKLLQRNINNKDNEITHQEHFHEEITRIKAHFEKKESEYYQNIYKLRRELQEKDAHLSQLKDRLINVDAKHSLNEQEILNSERRLTESKEESYHIEHELCQLKKNNEYLKNEIGRREVKLREHEVERVQILRKLKDSNKQVRLMQTKNAELQRDSAKYDQIINDLKTQIENMNKKYVTVNERQEKLKMEKDKIISDMNQTIIELKRKISDLEDTKKSLNLEIRDKDNCISMLYDELENNTKMVKKKEIELEREMENKMQIFKSNLNKDLPNKDSNFYETEIAKKDQMLVKINEGRNKMEASVKALGEEVKARDAKIDALATELQQRLEHHNKTQKNLENIISSKEKLVLDLDRKVEQRDAQVDSLKKKLEQDSSENVSGREPKIDAAVTNEIRELKKQLQHTLSKLHDTQAELDDTKTRLSKAMGNRLTDNNPNITDLSDRNRPTKLAEKCAELYDNQWTDAFEILETYFSTDEAVIESLLHILQATMNFCQKTAQNQLEELEGTLQLADNKENTDVSNSVKKQLKDTRKASALSALDNLRNMFASYLRQSADQTVTKALEIKEFTFECLELCWFMMVNDPPVAFAPLLAKGTHFNSDLYKPYTSSGTHVEYVVWPALLLHEGGPILAKGVAQGISKSKKNAFN